VLHAFPKNSQYEIRTFVSSVLSAQFPFMSGTRTNFSPAPGPRFVRRVPQGDTTERYVCDDCGHIYYTNPKIVVGSVVAHEERILMCRRAIEPRRGFWTLPAGFLEEHETPEEGARREAMEEAKADIVLEALLAVYSVPRISQVQLMYRAHLAKPEIAAGPESEEVFLFAWKNIPWSELAFPSVRWALDHYRQTKDQRDFAPFVNPPGETGSAFQRGAG
jgi:ADP-ribose pyrophosphatase YjhB (NUDIX family)